MNKGLFRLIFSTHLGMVVPAAESARARAGKRSCSGARSRRRALAALLALSALDNTFAAALDGLVPGGGAWVGANALQTSGNVATIQQTASTATLNFLKANLRYNETLNIHQDKTWQALIRINDINPSTINGSVNAAGHLYLINSNGIIFGNGAQINVGSLTATTLDVTDDLFNKGILSDSAKAVFSGTGGFVMVEQGAALTAASGGRVMLLAKNVTNHGVISTPDGQTILAAGEKAYLAESDDPAGLLVEVDAGGTAKNLGEIVAQRGNVTLVGLAVNQEGRISASTSVRANGSIHLLARDTVSDKFAAQPAQRGGVVTLGKGSTTTIDVETGDKEEALDEAMFDINTKTNVKSLKHPSHVEISGAVIDIDGSIVAHGGKVTATAAFNPNLATAAGTARSVVDTARIFLGKHALIDVSGLDASAPMSRNQLEIQLFSEQLKDTPILRDGPLFGQKIYVDARKDTGLKDSAGNDIKGTALTDIQPYLDLKGKTIAEHMTAGGTVSLDAGRGEVLMANGAVVDVSGGSVTYEAGYVRESSVLFQGKSIAISETDRNTPYERLTDVYTVTDPKWGVTRSWSLNPNAKGAYYASYSEGSDAGKVEVTAGKAVLDATFKAETAAAVARQRTAPPLGGTFSLTLPAGSGGTPPVINFVDMLDETLAQGFAAIGAFDDSTQKFKSGDTLAQGLQDKTQIATGLFANGFNQVSVKAETGRAIAVNAEINAAPDGSLTLEALGEVGINAGITMPGGDVTVKGGNIAVADGVTVSTSGLYTNDTPGLPGAMTSPVVLDGGDVTLSATGITTLGAGSVIDAGAGAWLQSNGKLKGGKGGNITLDGVEAIGEGQVRSYGFSKGGTLSVSTLLNAQIGGRNPGLADMFWLPEKFFTQGGFFKYNVSSSASGNTLVAGDDGTTVIRPQMMNLAARGGIGALQSGTPMASVAQAVLLPETQRAPASISLSANGALTVTEKTEIRTDAPGSSDVDGGAIDLSATGQLTILGSLIAPAGDISATVTGKMGLFDYDNTLSLFVGENATLSAAGHYAVAPPDGSGLLDAKVLDGGSITLDGGERAVVVVKEGSLLDVSGVSGTVEVAGKDGYLREVHDGAAGEISVSARNGMALDGKLSAGAADKGRDGALVLAIRGGDDTSTTTKKHPNGARVLTVTQANMLRANGLQAGDAVDGLTGAGAVSAEQITAGGFGSLSMEVDRNIAGDKIVLPSGLILDVPNALAMNASLLEVTGNGVAQVDSSYVMLNGTSDAAPVAGGATLNINADFIDLVGDVAFSGVRSASLSASHDIRGRGSKPGTKPEFSGSLKAPGELVLSARQIYPVTNGSFLFEASGAGSRIEVQSNGAAPGALLSAGGVLTLEADDIVQGGALRAPLGQITLNAANSLTLKDGSLTSVSLDGQLVPYGLTRLGGLDLLAPNANLVASENSPGLKDLPEKILTLKSPIVDMQEGAKVDISGGGDVMAYEFIKGIGGSEDFLGQADVYAVMPGSKADYAPFDYNYQIGSDIKPGDAVYLSGAQGLEAETYTLLPGRYALLPGAFVVKVESGEKVARETSIMQLDGSSLVSGYRTTLGHASRDAQYSTFRVMDGNIFRPAAGTISKAPAEYRLTTGNQFFTNLAADAGASVSRLASDAGQLTLDASKSLTLGAALLTGKDSGARGALVDITSDKISVVSSVGADDGTLQLTAGSLNGMAAESLLLGGSRVQDDDGLTVTTNASEVTFANDADHALQVAELIAVASDTLTVNDGAVIRTTANTQDTGSTRLHASGEGALLAASSLNDIEFDRSSVPASPSKGTLNIAAGAKLAAEQSVVLDATGAASLGGDVTVAVKYAADGKTVINNGSVTLGANSILLGDSGSASGMKVNDAMLERFGNLSKVSLNSYKNIDIYGPVKFGNDQLDITLNAGGIAGHLADGQVATLTANNFVLENSAGAKYVAPAGAAGVASSLDINANSITFAGKASSKTIIGGFDTANLNATGEVIFKDTGSTEIQAGQTNITSARITAATGADYTIAATGALTTANAIVSGILSDVSGLGAKLKMVAASIGFGGNVELPSGQFTAQATTGNLTVADGASIKAASVPVNFDKFTEHTPGGSVTLQADAGNVAVETGSTIDVSGSAGSDAGVLKLIATEGSATVNGTLKGEAGDGQQAGNFVLDTKTLPDFSGLNTALNSGGFTASRDMRIRNGDVTIAADDTVVAQQFVLSADAGKIDIAGTVNANGANGGNVEIYAKNDLTLKAGGKVLARGEGDSLAKNDGKGAGGSVLLSSDSGVVKAEVFEADGVTRLVNAAQIDVSGDKAGDIMGESGQVVLRAGRTGADNSAFNPVTTAGSATAYTVSGVTLARGVVVAFKPHLNNSGTTPALNGKTIKKNGGDALAAADLKVGKTYLAVYDGTNFQLISGDASGSLANGSGAVGTGTNIASDVPAAVAGAGDLRLEAVRTYEKTTLDAKAQLQLAADTQAFYSRANAVLAGYKPTQDGVTATLAPGVEVRSSNGDLTVSADWNMDTASNGTLSMPGAGTLTLRARDRLVLNGSISDDFSGALATSTLAPGNSWSYRLVSAADMGAVNPLATKAAVLDAPLNAIKASPVAATGKIVSDVVKLTATITGYSLDDPSVIAFSLAAVPTDPASSVSLNVSSTGEKALVKSDGSAINRNELIPGVPYLAKYDAVSEKYKLIIISDVVLANNKLIRTGTGDIRIAAGGDLTMGNEASVIYTVGRSADTLAGFTLPDKSQYLSSGGDIDIGVQGNINGKFTSSGAQQTVNHWLFRQGGGTVGKQVSWWVRPDLFKQGVATLGGGDVTISADGSITNFSASAATTARYASANNYVVDGGGDVTVTAGADINSGLYFAGQGDIRIHAGGAIQSSANTFGATIALMDASAEVSAVRNAAIETVFNPTMWAQVTGNAGTFDKTGSNAFFLTYGENSAFKLSSLTGDAGLGLANSASITGYIVTGTNSTKIAKDALEIHPGTVKATAFSGNIALGRLVMAPAATGDLSLLAAGDVSGSLIAMSDYDAALLPGITNPVSNSGGLDDAINQFRFTEENGENVVSHAGTPVHLGDEKPVVIVAEEGSISLTGVSTSDKFAGAGLLSPKAVYLHAGKDITLDADIQHLSSADISVIEAGRDFGLPTDPGSIVQLSGPGELLVQAGRNVTFGSTKGIVSVANAVNANLPGEGSSITVLAGLGKEGANLADYIADYINPTGSGPAVLQGDASKLAEYREQTGQAVTAYMRKLSGNNGLSDSDAMTQYLALDKDRQGVFAYRHFSSELLASGKGFGESQNHDRGDNAIARLFPADRKYDGDILMYKSQLRTSRDGSIDLLAPGGLINVGLAEKPKDLGHDIGMVTEKGGAIRAFAETGFQVNESKVITQYGSDITVWVNNGDIDAGRGSKTAVSVPERVVSTDKDGNTTIEVKGEAAGSGIRAQTYDPDGPGGAGNAPDLGSVALIAPRGILNAGEAGIAAGNFLAVATQVIGADNIQVSGSSSGVPLADTGSLAGSLAGVSNVASDATSAGSEEIARQVAQSANNPFTQMIMPFFVTVDVIGLGE